MLDSFTVEEITVIQGAFLRNNHLFIGNQDEKIKNIDMAKKKIVGNIDFFPYLNELEGIAPYKGKLLISNTTV